MIKSEKNKVKTTENGIIYSKNEEKLTKINNSTYIYKSETIASVSKTTKDKIQTELQKNVDGCLRELGQLTEENYNKAILELDKKSSKTQAEYKNLLANIDTVIIRETQKQFEKRKQENKTETTALIEHASKGLKLAKENFKKIFTAEKEKYEKQLKDNSQKLQLYKDSEE